MNKKIKRWLSIMLTLMLASTAVACSNENQHNSLNSNSRTSSASSEKTQTQSSFSSDDTYLEPDETSFESSVDSSTSENSTTPTQKKYKPVSALTEKSLPEIYGDSSETLNYNPDRGFRTQMNIDVHEVASRVGVDEDNEIASDYVAGRIRWFLDTFGQNQKYMMTVLYLYMDFYTPTGVDDAAVEAIDVIFKEFRKVGIKLRVSVCYQKYKGYKGASQEILNHDIMALSEVFHKNSDVIYMLQAGFIGNAAEWSGDDPVIDRTWLINTLTQNLLPENIYFSVRLPKYKNLLSKGSEYYQRTGFNNDAFFGKEFFGPSRGSGGLDPDTEAWEQWTEEAAYTPNDGEFYTSPYWRDNQMYPDPIRSIQGLSEHRYTGLSLYHGYGDAVGYEIPLSETVYGRLMRVEVTPDVLEKNGLLFAKNWFINKNGKAIKRNVFEFIRDHLGYNLEGKHVTVTGKSEVGGSLQIDLSLVNYGFSSVFNLRSGFVILDDENNVVSETEAGYPTDWHPTSPTNYSNRTQQLHRVSGAINLPTEPGIYKLAFYLKNEMEQYAIFGNRIEIATVKNGYSNERLLERYNVLHKFVLG